MHGQEIAVENADLFHAVSGHAQKIVRRWGEKRRGELAVIFDVLGGQHRRTRGDPTHDRNASAFGQADAARSPCDHFDSALSGQRPEMLFGGICRLKSQLPRDVCARGRIACICDILSDHVEYLLLSCGELHYLTSLKGELMIYTVCEFVQHRPGVACREQECGSIPARHQRDRA